MPTQEQIKDEDKRIRYLRRMVDLTMYLIIDSDMGLEDAQRHVEGVRNYALTLFPGKGDVFDLVYGPRFKRLLIEKYSLS
ncbi:MAG: hypothetical protein HYS21_08750 [Deltaproteobacteria bacterium]|nr:hypothetical protein [Deltaproteobacteria bacterium]